MQVQPKVQVTSAISRLEFLHTAQLTFAAESLRSKVLEENKACTTFITAFLRRVSQRR